MIKSKVSIGIDGLYVTSFGFSLIGEMSSMECSSRDSSILNPLNSGHGQLGDVKLSKD
jgi:hypothetical protein